MRWASGKIRNWEPIHEVTAALFNVFLHYGDLFEVPEYTADTDSLGTLRLLEAIRIIGMGKKVHFCQASTSELYGKGVC